VDGTLVDSRAEIDACMDEAFAAAGLPAPGYDRTRHVVGLSLAPGLQVLAPDADADTRGRILAAYRAAYFARRTDQERAPRLYPGAQDLLETLVDRGWTLGIATGKSRRGLDALMVENHWGRLFATTWCADDGPGKPHPFMVVQNMAAAGAAPDRTWVIGDTVHDMAMARAAGASAIGVTWGFGTRAEMVGAGAHSIHHTMDTLRTALLGTLPDTP
jgi:phosphoglycolate phosphatase